MSLSSRSSSRSASAKVERARRAEANLEISSFMKFMNKENWMTKTSRSSNVRPISDYMRGQYFAFVIMGGNPSFFSLEEWEGEFKDQIEVIANMVENLWGEAKPPIDRKSQELLGEVLWAIDWSPTDEDGLINIVSFFNAIPYQSEPDEIRFFWKKWKKGELMDVLLMKSFTTESKSFLRRYNFDVTSVAVTEVKSKLYNSIPLMGIELEFTYGGRLNELFPVLSMGVFKADSTTDVEFVSVPMEWGQLVEELEKRKESFNHMLKENMIETNGMHVHVSKKIIPLSQQARIFYLINAKKNQEFWSVIADRDVAANEYCNFASLSRKLIASVKSADYSQLAEGDFPDVRKTAVNRTKGETIEFRLFKSPNNLSKVIDNIKIVQAILDYTAQGGYKLKGFKKFKDSRKY